MWNGIHGGRLARYSILAAEGLPLLKGLKETEEGETT